MIPTPGAPSRRVVLQGTAAGLGLLVVGSHLGGRTQSSVAAPVPARRYWFRCWGPGYLNGDYSSIEEVWAAPGYTEIESVEVKVLGGGPHQLSPDEIAAVGAVERRTGRGLPDRSRSVLQALRVSTRTPPGRLPRELGAVGPPVVRLGVEMFPEAPQSGLLRRWLEGNS
jgi:hypothetical protein